jgi:hypothetical protein
MITEIKLAEGEALRIGNFLLSETREQCNGTVSGLKILIDTPRGDNLNIIPLTNNSIIVCPG